VKRLKGNLCLLAAAMIWGCAFVAQSAAADQIGPLTFNGIRFLIAAVTVSACMPMLRRLTKQEKTEKENPERLWKAGILAGAVLCIASVFQQAGIAWTTAGKAGFITSLYVVLVPVAGLLIHRVPKPHVFAAVVLALFGLYLLSNPENGSIGKGDFLEILAALCFTVHILIIDHYAGRVDALKFSAVQFLTAGVLAFIGAFFLEHISLSSLVNAAIPILYAGVFSAGLGYTLQIMGQQTADPSQASMILSLESVFAALFGYLILHEVLSIKELAGCVLMFAAVLLSQRQG